MARLIFSMNQSLDGYVDHTSFAPGSALFRHFIGQVGGLSGSIYGTTMYEVMCYWDDDSADWGDDERAFAIAWRKQPKWVVSHTLKSVGPNATLVASDLGALARDLKARLEGEIEAEGTKVAASLTALDLIDEYRIYLHPVVVGSGKPFFAGPRPPLRLVSSERIDGNVLRLCYVPA